MIYLFLLYHPSLLVVHESHLYLVIHEFHCVLEHLLFLENLVVHLYHGHLFDLLQGGIMNYRELKMIVYKYC